MPRSTSASRRCPRTAASCDARPARRSTRTAAGRRRGCRATACARSGRRSCSRPPPTIRRAQEAGSATSRLSTNHPIDQIAASRNVGSRERAKTSRSSISAARRRRRPRSRRGCRDAESCGEEDDAEHGVHGEQLQPLEPGRLALVRDGCAMRSARSSAPSSKPLKTSAIGCGPTTNDRRTSTRRDEQRDLGAEPIAMFTARSILSFRATSTATQCSAALPTMATTISADEELAEADRLRRLGDRADEDLRHDADRHAGDGQRDDRLAAHRPGRVRSWSSSLVLEVEQVLVRAQREEQAARRR